MRCSVTHDAINRVQHHSNCGLVVTTQNGLVGVGEPFAILHHLNRREQWHGVDMGAEHYGRAGRSGRKSRDDVVATRWRHHGGRIVLGDARAHTLQLTNDGVGHRALLPGWRGDLAQPHKQLAHLTEPCDHAVAVVAESPPTRPAASARATAAPMNARKRGCGRVGLLLNSGWYWLATKKG